MKRAFSIFLSILVILPNLTRFGILVDFKLNQDFIAKVLCIEKEVPMSNCNGKCYLAELLKKAENKEEQKQIPGKTESEFSKVVFYLSKCTYQGTEPNHIFFKKTKNVYSTSFYVFDYTADVFHPPKFHLA